jgi:hypothetical protein
MVVEQTKATRKVQQGLHHQVEMDQRLLALEARL